MILAATLAPSLLGLACASPLRRSVAYYDPAANNGSMLNNAGDGLGEPLNVGRQRFRAMPPLLTDRQVIVSGLSSADVLTDDGIVKYARAIG